MQSPMQIRDNGKRLGRAPVAPAPGSFSESSQHITISRDSQTLLDHSVYVVDNGDTAFPLLYLTDKHSGTRYLVDCGATVSIFPASLQDQNTLAQTSPLIAANGSHIATFGTREIRLDLGFRRTSWSFRLANVTKPILGLDFLSAEHLAVNFQQRTLYATSPCAGGATERDINGNCAVLHVDTPDHDQWSSILSEFPTITTSDFRSPNTKHGISHHIPTTGPPPHVRARRLPPDRLADAKKAFEDMVAEGICRRSSSPYAAPLHMVRKPDGSWRPCGDYRLLNAATTNDRYPVPHIQDFNANLDGCTVFSKIDLRKGYHQIPVAPDDIHKTAVITPFGLFEFLRMPFGLSNAGQTFQRLMDHILRGLPFTFVYVDDILVASRNHEEHARHLRQVFQLLAENGLVINRDKCVFGKATLDFLCHTVSKNGITPPADRVECILRIQRPTSTKALQEFLGAINFYHRFIPHAAEILRPLHAVLQGSPRKLKWGHDQDTAFQKAKQALSDATLLVHPNAKAVTAVTCDASGTAVGASLDQLSNGEWKPLAFFSRKLSRAELKYSAFDRELLAIYLSIKHFRYFLEG